MMMKMTMMMKHQQGDIVYVVEYEMLSSQVHYLESVVDVLVLVA